MQASLKPPEAGPAHAKPDELRLVLDLGRDQGKEEGRMKKEVGSALNHGSAGAVRLSSPKSSPYKR